MLTCFFLLQCQLFPVSLFFHSEFSNRLIHLLKSDGRAGLHEGIGVVGDFSIPNYFSVTYNHESSNYEFNTRIIRINSSSLSVIIFYMLPMGSNSIRKTRTLQYRLYALYIHVPEAPNSMTKSKPLSLESTTDLSKPIGITSHQDL